MASHIDERREMGDGSEGRQTMGGKAIDDGQWATTARRLALVVIQERLDVRQGRARSRGINLGDELVVYKARAAPITVLVDW